MNHHFVPIVVYAKSANIYQTVSIQNNMDYSVWGMSELIERIEVLEAIIREADTLLEPREDTYAEAWRDMVDRNGIKLN